MRLLLMLLLLLTGSKWYDGYLKQIPQQSVKVIRLYAKGFDVTRSAEVQAALLDEDLVWQRLGLSEEQRLLVVSVALDMALDRAEKQIRKAQANGVKGDAAKHLPYMLRFRSEAERLLRQNTDRLAVIDWTAVGLKFFLKTPGGKPK